MTGNAFRRKRGRRKVKRKGERWRSSVRGRGNLGRSTLSDRNTVVRVIGGDSAAKNLSAVTMWPWLGREKVSENQLDCTAECKWKWVPFSTCQFLLATMRNQNVRWKFLLWTSACCGKTGSGWLERLQSIPFRIPDQAAELYSRAGQIQRTKRILIVERGRRCLT